ncbi:MAG: hypothetical protein IJI19_06080 [Ruminococcus sp.]|nr:hypothetical protein [Ruminococcus sp.]
MDKAQALYSFWSSFGLTAYDEQTIPDNAQTPYITFETNTDSLDQPLALTASLWYRDTSWATISEKAEAIAAHIGRGGSVVHYDDGALWITRRAPFAQRIADPNDDGIRRIYMNINAEYLGAD